MKVMMRPDKPKEEGIYFCQYHRNFEPVICTVRKRDDGRLWLHTKSTSKPLDEVKAFCFSNKI